MSVRSRFRLPALRAALQRLGRRLLVPLALAAALLPAAQAGEINVAVAANFSNPLKVIAAQFSRASGHRVNLSAGSTGKLYAQIINGAPFDVFLAANVSEPARLENERQAVAGSRFTYAVGRLALWSADPMRVRGDCAAVLMRNDYARLAIANPDTAPYGQQARNALKNLGLLSEVEKKLIVGSDIGQAFQYVYSRNVELGIVSLAQVLDPNNQTPGSHCLIPQALYEPLLQQAVLLWRAADNPAARDFLVFLRSPAAQDIIRQYGYGLVPQDP